MKKAKPKAPKTNAPSVAELLKQVQELRADQKIVRQSIESVNELLTALIGRPTPIQGIPDRK
jgi:hypothetical protein